MQGPDSPLQVIKQKESQLRQQIEAARRQAQARVQAARAEAELEVQQADEAGRLEAAAYYQDGIALAHREAKAITTEAGEKATALRRQAMSRLDEVATQITGLVHAAFNDESADHRDEAVPG